MVFGIDKVRAGGARAEVGAAGTDVDVMLGVAVARPQGEAARRLAQRVLHHVRGQADTFAVHPRAGLLQDFTGFCVLNVQARVLQQVEDAVEQLLQLILRENVEPYARIGYIVRPHVEGLLSQPNSDKPEPN